MARADLLNVLYSKDKSPLEFKFDSLWLPPLCNYMHQQDIQALYNVATSIRYSANIEMKYAEIKRIMENLGFKKLACGTNRIVYSFLEDQSFVVKIALDKVGINDNPAEFRNQNILKPFITKVFDVTPCGTVGSFERVESITSEIEFAHMGSDVYELLVNFIIGKYVLEDIGAKYFMNWGVRKGFGPCLLDFPYVFELDGNKMHCTAPLTPYSKYPMCDGDIDYDNGFNRLVCEKCGREYFANDLKQKGNNKIMIVKGDSEMSVRLIKNGVVVCDPGKSSNYIKPNEVKEEVNLPYTSQSRLVMVDEYGAITNKDIFNAIKITPNKNKSNEQNLVPNKVIPKLDLNESVYDKPPVDPVYYRQDESNILVNSYIKEEPTLIVSNQLKNEQQVRSSTDFKEEDYIKKPTPDEQFVIYNILGLAMLDYPFENDKAADQKQKNNITEYLKNHLDNFITTNNMDVTIDTNKAIESYIKNNYVFAEIYSDSIEQFGITEKDFNEPELPPVYTNKRKPDLSNF